MASCCRGPSGGPSAASRRAITARQREDELEGKLEKEEELHESAELGEPRGELGKLRGELSGELDITRLPNEPTNEPLATGINKERR